MNNNYLLVDIQRNGFRRYLRTGAKIGTEKAKSEKIKERKDTPAQSEN